MKQKTVANRKIGMSTEHISQCVLYVLTGLSVLVFAAFYLVGFDMPYWRNESINAPLLTDWLIGIMVLLLLLAIVTVTVAGIRSIKINHGARSLVYGIPARKISIAICSLTTVSLLAGFLFGSSEPMLINGEKFANWWWLKASDMLITAASVLLLATIGAIIWGSARSHWRK